MSREDDLKMARTIAWWDGWLWGALTGALSLAVLLTLLVVGGACVGC